MLDVPAMTDLLQVGWRSHRQTQRIIQLPAGQQSCIFSDSGSVKLKPQPTVKMDPQCRLFRFTHWVPPQQEQRETNTLILQGTAPFGLSNSMMQMGNVGIDGLC